MQNIEKNAQIKAPCIPATAMMLRTKNGTYTQNSREIHVTYYIIA